LPLKQFIPLSEPKPKFLITDTVPEGFIEGFEKLGFEVDYRQKPTNSELFEIAGQYTGIVVNTSLILTKEVLDKAILLKYILRPGSGLDNVDVDYAKAKGIEIFNSPEANADAVAEHVIGMIFSLLDFIPRASEQVKQLQWIRQPNNGTLFKGKTIAIIGYGNTGSALAKKLSGFGVHILVYDKYKKGFGNETLREASMREIFDKADLVSLHIPLTNETEYLVNDGFIDNFKKPIYLLNTSRGKNVKLDALIHGLKAGKILGVALDVLENENIISYSAKEKQQLQTLITAGNVIVTPHIAGWTKESREQIFMMVLEKFGNYFISHEGR